MTGQIKFKEHDITIMLETGRDNRNFSFVKNSILHKIVLLDSSPDSQEENITVRYVVTKIDSEGEVLNSNAYQIGFSKTEYTKWANYNLTNVTGTWLELAFKPVMNTVLAHYFQDENFYCFNPLKGFEFFQAVILEECAVNEREVSASVNSTSVEGKALRYAIVDSVIRGDIVALMTAAVWQESELFTNVANGSYTMLVKTIEDGWIAKKDFQILIEE